MREAVKVCDACKREWDRFVDADGKPTKRKRKARGSAAARDASRHPHHPTAGIGGSGSGAPSHGRRARGLVPDDDDDVPLGPAAPFEVRAIPDGDAPPLDNPGEPAAPRQGVRPTASSTGNSASPPVKERDAPPTPTPEPEREREREREERPERGSATAEKPRGDATTRSSGSGASGSSLAAVAMAEEADDAEVETKVAEVYTREITEHEDEPAPRRSLESPDRYLCPTCNTPSLVAIVTDDGSHARCERCRHAVEDLLSLIPVQPVGVARLTLGGGAVGVVNALLLVILVVALLVSVLIGR